MVKQISIPCLQKTGQESKHTMCQEQIGRSITHRHGKNINLVNNEKKQLQIYHYNSNWCSVQYFFFYRAQNCSFYCSHHHIYAALWQAFSYMYMYFQPWYYCVSGVELCLGLRAVKPCTRRRFLLNGIKHRRVFLKLIHNLITISLYPNNQGQS